MKVSKKQWIYIGATLAAGIGAFFLFRSREIVFYDYVWCENGTSCSDYDTQAKVNSYITETGGDASRSLDGDGTGMYQLLFPKPHGLVEGQTIYVVQDEGAEFIEYNGVATIDEVLNDFVIRLDKPRLGSAPANGGVVLVPSYFKRMFN